MDRGGKIRVLVVDDSMFFRATIIKGISQCPSIEVVGEAFDPYEARDKILDVRPDVITLDIEMPYMNGLDFLKVLLPQWKVPVVVVSSFVGAAQEALRAGAADFLPKPANRTPEGLQHFVQDLTRRIQAASGFKHLQSPHAPARQASIPATSTDHSYAFQGLIALGASTGGTQSTTKILKALPADIPGMIVVQHMPADFTRMYAESLDRDCVMRVREAKDGDAIERGLVLIAPGGAQHTEVHRRGTGFCVRLVAGEKVNGHSPSVDVLFNSVAKAASGSEAVGIILTGMGADGANGLLAMRKKGCFTIGQDERSSVVYGMPREAFERGAVVRQVALDSVASVLMKYVKDLHR